MQNKDKKLRGVAYIRESTEDQDKGFSPENQKQSIIKYANEHNIDIVEWYKDLLSGRDATKRDDFQRMISDAKENKFDAVLVFHTSRFARNVGDARYYKRLLRDKLNIQVISITQYFGNHEDPTAFFSEVVVEAADELTSRNISFWVRTGLEQKRSQGNQLGNPPFGYYKKKIGHDTEKDRPIYENKWIVHADDSKIVQKIYQLYATGKYSFSGLASEINKAGAKTKVDNPFTYGSIKDILKNHVYTGYVYSPRRGYPKIRGNHPRIISDTLFEKVQDTIGSRTRAHGRPTAQHRIYLLQGLIYCYACRKYLEGKEGKPQAKLLPKMYCEAQPRKKGERHVYKCKIRREYKGCTQSEVACDAIDKQVLTFMEGFNIPEDIISLILEKLEKLFKEASNSTDLALRVSQLKKRKIRINTMFELEEMDEEKYRAEITNIRKELKRYEQMGIKGSNSQALVEKRVKETEKFLRDFKKFWNSGLGKEEQSEWIRMTIKRVWVKGKKVVAIEPHDQYKDLFQINKKFFKSLNSISGGGTSAEIEKRKVGVQFPLVTPV